MKSKQLSLSALAAFVFAASLAASATPVETPCQRCERIFEQCGTTQACVTAWNRCMRANGCPF
ncbi:hypothetical protein [Lysobacter sp. TAB13]|uniref:hypothetical protein n=1 Tax=Lysobacter sp. TAB13 TaxID=3233065 RepID=UPI003F994095